MSSLDSSSAPRRSKPRHSRQLARVVLQIAATERIDDHIESLFPTFLCQVRSLRLGWVPCMLEQVIAASPLDALWKSQLIGVIRAQPAQKLCYYAINSEHMQLWLELGELPRQLCALPPHIIERQLAKLTVRRPLRQISGAINNTAPARWPVALRHWYDAFSPQRLRVNLLIEPSPLALKTMAKLLKAARREGVADWERELTGCYLSWHRDPELVPLLRQLHALTRTPWLWRDRVT